MSEGLGENSRLLDYSGKMYNQEENGNVLQLRDWLDDPYEQVSVLSCLCVDCIILYYALSAWPCVLI